MNAGCRRKLLEMEEEGIGTFGAPVWEGTDTIWQQGCCLGACQISEARGGGAEIDSERWCQRVNHGTWCCLRAARPMLGPKAGPCTCIASPAEVPGLLWMPRLLVDSGVSEAPRHRHCFIIGSEMSSLLPNPSMTPVSPGPFGNICRGREGCEKAIWFIQVPLGAEL